MKTNFNPSSTCVSAYMSARNFARNSANNFRRIAVLLVLLLSFAFGARAQSVIMSGDYFLTHNNDGTSVNAAGTTTFNPATCLWYVNNRYIRTADSDGNAFSGNNYLQRNSLTLGSSSRWSQAQDGSTVYYSERSMMGSTNYYLRLEGTTWVVNSTNRNVGSLIKVNISTVSSTSTPPTINGNDVLTATDNYTYTASGAAYQAGGYTNYYFNSENHYYNSDNSAITPEAAILNTAWSISANEYATINNSGVVTVNSIPTSDVTLTITATVTVSGGNPVAPAGTTLVGTKEITIQGSVPAAPTISVSGTTVTLQTDATGTTSIRYTIDGTDPTATTGTVYNGAFDISGSTSSPVTIKAITVRNGNASSVTTQQVKLTLPEPDITVNAATGTATITCSNSSATIYYTTDGSAPSATNGTQYNGEITGLTTMATVKAIAICDGWNSSSVASATMTIPSGVSGGTVTLFDYEDHNWTYYQPSGNLPTGYPTTYLSSPNPRNVKITYKGGAVSGASAVAISAIDGEGQNTMVYYKTLEKSVPGMTGDYPYTVISNPFSKRPRANGSTGTNGFYGFAGWKLISGGEYIAEYNDGQTLPLDVTIHFTNLDNNYTPNCTSGEVVFEATWTPATVKTGNSAQSFNNTGNYETNFWVLSGSNNIGNITVPGNCTVSSRYPDGTVNFTRNLTGSITAGGNNAKVEFVNMNSTGNVSAEGYTFTMGRGIVNNNNGGTLYGVNSNKACTNTVKIESGTYSDLRNFGKGISAGNSVDQLMILGCDYDRAKNDNTKLRIRESMYVGYEVQLNRATNSLYMRCYVKGGNLGSTVNVAGNNGYDGAGGTNTYYFSVASTHNAGRRFLCVEGGRLDGIAGGMDETDDQSTTDRSFDLRVRGTAQIDGVVYGAAEFAGARGTRTMVFTGGTINGWIAAGANGTQSSGGLLAGSSYLYFGGKAKTDSGNSNQVMNRAVGGNVFGAGCGHNATSNSGQVDAGTNVVVADEAYVERGVYGGGSYGFTEASSNIFITGGHVDGNIGGTDGTDYDETVTGGVFGGACQNRGGVVNVFMTGGKVNGGLYGGSNKSGTISSNVTMQINGGQVGTSSAPANIHGGGYGKNTAVKGSIDMTLGIFGQETKGVEVWGDVYGGSALGYVNFSPTINSNNQITGGNYTQNTYTNVTMNKATINGSLYGGALGDASTPANVYGPVEVKVRGGSVKATSIAGSGGVYGANNINGAPQRSVTVDIYGTDPAPAEGEYALYAVYGGGNQADYLYGNGYPTVTVHGCDNSIEYVYGGGNAAAVKTTNVTIWGGNVIGNVFGGGHGYKDGAGADVEGNVNVAIKGGTIKRVFGGSNSKGNISGTINLVINKDGACDMRIGEVYGGGNEADGNAGSLTIGCTGALVEGDEGHAAHPENIGKKLEGIGAVYGGANNANVTNASGITLNINSGMVANVFGGNNTGGGINGTITVNVNKNEETCGWYVGNVFGGGNLAQYSGSPAVNILNGEVSGNVYGGGKGDANDHSKGQVTGSPTVTIGDNANAGHTAIVKGDVYGGGDAGNVVGIPVVNVVNKCNTTIGNVYGGGNAADVNGTDVNIDGGKITGMVFGGGHGDKNADPQTEANVNGNVNVDITGGTINKVFGGSNSKGNITGTIAMNIEKADGHCDMYIAEVYGGGNEAAGNAGIITIGCTGGETEGIGDVYGGANAADINTGITLNITGGNIKRVFGGNNTSGSINGDIQVNVDWTGTCGVNALGNVYGAGNQAAYSGNTEVNILNGTVTGSVYGGGLGATAVVTGATKVNIDGSADGHSVMVTQNVLGGGDAAAVTGSTDVNIINGTISGSVFGGGNAAGVSVNGVVDITGGTIASGVYGGSNASGTVGNTTVTLTNGIIGTDAAHANVHGGGYGNATQVSGNVAVNINGGTIYGDVYGGSALGTVNTDANNTTAVNLTGGLVHGDAYGGGLGDSDTKADVNGNVTVTLNGTAFTLATTKDDEDNTIPTSGRVFGCNNINGSPKGTVLVKVLKTVTLDGANIKQKPAKDSGIYELQAVYGGGNLAAYNPTDPFAEGQFTSYIYGGNTVSHENTDKPVQVVIDGCDLTSIEYVYGGGNAAATPATDVIVLGSYEIGNVFGGGNGKDKYKLDGGWEENPGADVGIIDAVAYANNHANGLYGTGKSKASVLGGTVHNLFGASNTKGNVVTESLAYVDDAGVCTLNVGGIYGGGNEAYMDGDSKIVLGCIKALEEIYGGARNADVKGDINLTISSGHFDRVFGGNNIGGKINGSITVTIEETGCNPISIGELYGCGNQAAYTTPAGKEHPTINLKSFTSIGNVFGGGLGEDAVVTGNPTVNINVVEGANSEHDWAYNGQTITFSDGSKVTLPTHETGKIGAIGNVFGGGNAAAVIGNTQVNIGTEVSKSADIRGNVYGGGNQANVTGQTNVVIGQ